MIETTNQTNCAIVEQVNCTIGSKRSEPYFFDVIDPASTNLSEQELDSLLLERFLFIDAKGKTWEKHEVIEHLVKGEPEIEIFEHSDIEVINFGQDKAYVQRSILRVKGKFLGRELDGRFRAGAMVVDTDAGWKLFNYQLTPTR